jgi:uncharacterized peroxidase-related enzyme
MTDYRQAELDSRTRALLDYCVKLTRTPKACDGSDIDALRTAGWSDAAIHDAVQVTGFFNYYDRLADGLGVEPEPDWTADS